MNPQRVEKFVVIEPNCGHESTTFTWYALGELWLCGACFNSIGRLGACCMRCHRPPPTGTNLREVHRAGLLCVICQREHTAFARRT